MVENMISCEEEASHCAQTSCQLLYQRLSSKSYQLRMQICFSSVDLWLPAMMCRRDSLVFILSFILREYWFAALTHLWLQ